MATNEESPKIGTDVNQLLPENDIAATITRNKVPLAAAGIALLAIIFGYGYFSQATTKKYNKYADALSIYTDAALKDMEKKDFKPSEIVSGFRNVYQGKEGFASAGTMMAELSDKLIEKGHQQEAYDLLAMGVETQDNIEVLYFLRLRAAAVAEDLGKNLEALSHLEAVIASGSMYMADKVYLDAGRLYAREGKVEKAKASFNWVIKEGSEAEFKKMANLYLGQL